jgi:RNA polymerase sigma-70 factor (ECF subfamily)
MRSGEARELRRGEFDAEALPHLDRLYSAAFYLCGDRDHAADLVQETFLRAFRFFHQFEPGTNCRAWLLTILHNTFRNQRRAGERERRQLDIDDPGAAREATEASGIDSDPQSLVLAEFMDQEIVQALGELPEEFRSAVVAIDLQELTYEEGARALGCPVGTIRSRLSRGRHLLERKLASYASERGIVKDRR